MARRSDSTAHWSDHELEELLARGYLSGRQYDEIEERIMAQVAAPKGARTSVQRHWHELPWVLSLRSKALEASWPSGGLRGWFAVLLAGAGAIVLFLFGDQGDGLTSDAREHTPALRDPTARPDHDGFVAKGGPPDTRGALYSGVLDVGCDNSEPHRCRKGDTLMFSANTAVASGYVGAYAERVGDVHSAERIWYFPSANGDSPLVQPGSRTMVVSRGIRLGAEHTPGHYRITVWLSRTPVSRGASADLGVVARDELTIEVVP